MRSEEVVATQAALQLTDYQARVNLDPLGEKYNAFFRKEWANAGYEPGQLALGHTEFERFTVGGIFFVVDLLGGIQILIDQISATLPVLTQHMFQLVPQHEPEVVDSIQT